MADEGPTGPVHAQHAGKVVFSKEPVARAPSDDSAFTDRFTLREPIYVRPFLSESLENRMRRNGITCTSNYRRVAVVVVNGEPRDKATWIENERTHRDDFAEWTTYSFGNSAETSLTGAAVAYPDDRDRAAFRFSAGVLPKLHVGENSLHFFILGSCVGTGPSQTGTMRVAAADGELKLSVAAGDVKRYGKRHGPFLPRPSQLANRAMTKQIEATVEREWNNEDVMGSVITSSAWEIRRHKLTGRPISRTLEAAVVVKRREAQTCRLFNLAFTQNADDRGGYERDFSMATGSSIDFPCTLHTARR